MTGRARTRDQRVPGSGAANLRASAWILFAASLAIRLLFWRATPDASWPYNAAFKGDALVWLDYASALRGGQPFELGLPIHPPGAGYLIAALWNGSASGVSFLRFAWCVMGAAIPPLVFLAAALPFGVFAASLAGALCACSTGLLLLSASLNNETPYLLLVCASLALLGDLRERPRAARLAAFSALNGIACLFRVEHALFFALVLAWLALGWWRARSPRRMGAVGLAAASFLLPLVPWHAKAWSAIARFNREPLSEPAAEAAEAALAAIRWTPEAARMRDGLPAFARRTASAFVGATVVYRGLHGGEASRPEVRPEDFGILDEAFGYVPRPVAGLPFVSSYGPLNFALANREGATGGFDASLLEAAPPLAGGASRYPPALVRGLPPPQLALAYPPHLRLFNEGYSIGLSWIREHPGAFARLAAKKLDIFWSGAALGLTGWNLPMGLSGTRRAVDLAAPVSGPVATSWRIAILALAALGAAVRLRQPALVPWLLFFATKAAAAAMFFGYARLGATAFPAVSLLVVLAVDRAGRDRSRVPGRRAGAVAAAVLALGVVAEAARFLSHPEVTLDGRAVDARGDPFPADLHRDQVLEVR